MYPDLSDRDLDPDPEHSKETHGKIAQIEVQVQGSSISRYLHKINIERKVWLEHMITR